jgi:hypothetical protein
MLRGLERRKISGGERKCGGEQRTARKAFLSPLSLVPLLSSAYFKIPFSKV